MSNPQIRQWLTVFAERSSYISNKEEEGGAVLSFGIISSHVRMYVRSRQQSSTKVREDWDGDEEEEGDG